MILFKISSLINFNKEYKHFSNNLEIAEIDIEEYCYIYQNYTFENNSHIQSPGYYLKSENINYFKIKKDHKIIAILSFLNKKIFFNIFNLGRINSGPLIIKEFNEYKYFILLACLKFIKKKYIKFISFAPPSLYTEDRLIKSYNCFKLKYLPSQTYLLDLVNSEEYIFKNLRSNWRNSLRKGLKLTKVREIDNMNSIKLILKEYKNFAFKLGFKPVSIKKCIVWSENAIKNRSFLRLKIYQAYNANNEKESLGGIGILCFKDSALYLFGYTSKQGKKFQANYALLWKGIIDQKNNGFKKFDLGGIDEKNNRGIMKFKEGLNGLLEKKLGEYFYFGIF